MIPAIAPAVHSLWLMPRADDAAALDALIAELAPRFGSAIFRAHVTVQGDLATPLEPLRTIAATLAAACPVLDWPLAGVASSPHYFRSFYLELQPHADFDRLRSTAAALSGTTDGLAPFPHLSLAYGDPTDPADKPPLLQRHARMLDAKPALRFDRLVIARSAKSLAVANWSVLESFALG